MPKLSDDVERFGGGDGTGGFRFKSKCKAVKSVSSRVLVLKQGCKCGQNHLFATSACRDWNWKIHEVLERAIEGIEVNTASDIILSDKCSWEILMPIENYLKGWSVSREWKLQGVFDRKSDLSATGFKSTEELIFALLKKEATCDSRYECDHRILEVTAIAKEPEQGAESSVHRGPGPDLLPMYQEPNSPKPLNEKQTPWSTS